MFPPGDTSFTPYRVMTWHLCEEIHFDDSKTHGNSNATAGPQFPYLFCLPRQPHLNGTNQNDKNCITLEIKASCHDSLAYCSLWPNELTFVQGEKECSEWQNACTSHACTVAGDALPLCLLCRKSMAVSFYHACFYNKEQLQNLKKIESVWTCKQKPDF